MATRPSEYPEWADGGGAVITDPTLAFKQQGWVVGKKPPAGYENWRANNVYKWILYFDALFNAALYGSGADGVITCDGVGTPVGMTKIGSVYTMTRDIFATNMTVAAGVTVFTNGFRLFGTGTLTTTNTSSINADGAAAIGASGGVAGSSGTISGSQAGGAGGTGGSTNGYTGLDVANAFGGNGGAGGPSLNGTGGAAGTASAPVPADGNAGTIQAYSLQTFGSITGLTGTIDMFLIAYQGGGSGGGGGAVTAGASGGGGGAGGGVLCIAFRALALGGGGAELTAKGGAATAAQGTNAGGGGGGGGGVVVVVWTDGALALSAGTNTPGGARGLGNGTGAPGVAGSNGQVFPLQFGSAGSIASTSHVEEGVVTLAGSEVSATAAFNTPFANTPGNPGGYIYEYSIARTDGVAAVPAILLTATATNQMQWTIIDRFAGTISWRAKLPG